MIQKYELKKCLYAQAFISQLLYCSNIIMFVYWCFLFFVFLCVCVCVFLYFETCCES